jgi:DNA-binding protein H-NS
MASFAELKKMAEAQRKIELPTALAKIHSLMVEYNISFDELLSYTAAPVMPPVKSSIAKKKTTATKYKYMNNGIGYTGKGRPPEWVKVVLASGGNLDDYLVGKKPVESKKRNASKASTKKSTRKSVSKPKAVAATAKSSAATTTKPAKKVSKPAAAKKVSKAQPVKKTATKAFPKKTVAKKITKKVAAPTPTTEATAPTVA